MRRGATMAENRRTRSGGTNSDDDPLTVIAAANARMPTERLPRDVTLLKELWESYGDVTSKSYEGFMKMFHIFQEREIISPANIEVLELFQDWWIREAVEPSSDFPSRDDTAVGYKKHFIQELKSIGEGSSGKVYKVQHKLDKKYYALKQIEVPKSESDSLRREIQILANLNHRNVVRYHQSWFENEFHVVSKETTFVGHGPKHQRPTFGDRLHLYIQMELCSSTLRMWLSERNEKISQTESQFDVVNEKENQNIYMQILEGMNYIHSQRILHRDVAPKNIFLSAKDDGHPLVKIGDFGLAREENLTELKTRDQDSDESSEDPSVPPTYTSDIGTKKYASPEQLAGTAYDNKSDMYSMGLILFELYHPFGIGGERHECLEKLRAGNIPEELKERWPAQHLAIQRLTRLKSQERPSASDLLSGDTFTSQDKIIESLEEKIQRLEKEITQRDAEISQLKENRIPKT